MALVVRPAAADDVEVIRELSERAFLTLQHIYQPNARALEKPLTEAYMERACTRPVT